ncbi:unnamed protein product [Triticum turgidum subsp. durum]|uniref:DUF632 domain-containing protein n=1 Tax=Triticum turgidum subsp. durum TaxID=4567 RepID=A0A9R0Z1Y2_TRITD|nr:unnamed protein product [Triticum turgidum subsp. durum]
MGSSPSKAGGGGGEGALALCKERLRRIRRAIDSRDALSAAHLSYTRSLRGVGTALRRHAEAANLSPESSLSISEAGRSPSRSSMASPSPSRVAEADNTAGGSPSPILATHRGGDRLASPSSSSAARVHCMKAAGTAPLTFTVDPSTAEFVGQESPVSAFVPPPPPLPSEEMSASWDFFDAPGAARANNVDGLTLNFDRLKGLRESWEAEPVTLSEEPTSRSIRMHSESEIVDDNTVPKQETKATQRGISKASGLVAASEQAVPKAEEGDPKRESHTETEDPSEFITHRAKDFVSSMKEIETRFIRAAEAGNEVSRMLETKKIRLDISAKIPGSPGKPTARFVSALRVCCNRQILLNQETAQHVSNVVTWKRSVSSLSSSSKSPLTTSIIQDDVDDSNNDFIEQFAMVSGSHSSTLDRLHAWERKLYDEIKNSLIRLELL